MKFRSKLPNLALTIFSEMTQLANEHGAINLSQGFPDFDVHSELVELVGKHMRAGNNQYAPMQGVLALREMIARKVRDLYGASYDPATEITVTSGATEALYAVITAVVHPGDEVIVIEPAFDSYVPAIALSGGVPRYVKLKYPDYRIDWNEIEDAINPKTALIILNTPHNPTGAAFSKEDLSNLTDLIADKDVFIAGDEVYEHIIFDGLTHESLVKHPELAARSFVVSSFGKTYHTTGWKIGYCLAPEVLSKELQKIHQFLTFASNTPIQFAYAEFMRKKEHYLELGRFYQTKRDRFLQLLENSRFKPLPCRGTYFQMLDYSDITDEPDMDFARRLTTEHGVAAIPPSVFYHDGEDNKVLRFCFAKKDNTLEEAASRLSRI